MTPSLGRLEKVDLRYIWETEAQDFTPWLAREDNLAILGETLKMELELEAQEKKVGPFSADLLCTNTDDGSMVLIENQLERTDHTHLGQLITYAAGLHTVNIVWIASPFTDEHRAALDWLNEITDTNYRFFGLEVELWKIGESPPAPKFNIISKPNDWSRSVAKEARNKSARPTKLLQQDYWQALKEFGEMNGSELRFQSPRPQHWFNFGIGKTNTKLVALVNSRTKKITVGFESYGDAGTLCYENLHAQKAEIERELGFSPDWLPLEGKKVSAIWYSRDGDISDKSQWPELHNWMITHLEKMDKVFRPRVKAMDLTSNDEEDDA
ncbi:MAG: DUF4268 domain-containing protein [Alphaproteobacteria bacterium]|nr:DUF4268 domain-containing protein [Alphaproteobacteria bacterium]